MKNENKRIRKISAANSDDDTDIFFDIVNSKIAELPYTRLMFDFQTLFDLLCEWLTLIP